MLGVDASGEQWPKAWNFYSKVLQTQSWICYDLCASPQWDDSESGGTGRAPSRCYMTRCISNILISAAESLKVDFIPSYLQAWEPLITTDNIFLQGNSFLKRGHCWPALSDCCVASFLPFRTLLSTPQQPFTSCFQQRTFTPAVSSVYYPSLSNL